MPSKTRARPKPWCPPLWRVRVRGHQVGSVTIPAAVVELPAVSAEAACAQVIRWCQSDAGVAPWLPYRRESLPFTAAESVRAAA